MSEYISSYLLKPLRSYEEFLLEMQTKQEQYWPEKSLMLALDKLFKIKDK